MNIAIFTDTYYPDANGISVYTKILVETLKSHGNQVVVVTSSYDNKKPSNENYIHYVPFSSKRKRSVFATMNIYMQGVFKEIKAFKPDIIHNQTNGQIGQLAEYTAAKLDVPFVYTYHIHYEEYAPYAEGSFFHRVYRAHERSDFRRTANLSTEFIVPNIKIKNYLRKKGVDRYINVITTGIDPSKFEIDDMVKKDTKYIRKKFDIKDDEAVLLYVGSLSKEKNIDFLLKALKGFMKSGTKHKVHLLIVGDGEEMETLNFLAKQQDLDDVVSFVGKVNHNKIKSYYYNADIYVSASTSETQNITIMEAMLTNCIVLGKNDESLTHFIDEEKNGFVYNDEEDFIVQLEKILSLKEKEKEKILKLARQKITDEFNLETYYQRIMEVYTRAQKKNW